MQTQEAPVVQEAVPEQPEKKHLSRMPWLIVALVVLGLIAVGLAIAAIDDDASDPQLETATELVDTMHEGLREDDEEKFMSVFTEDAVFGSGDPRFEVPMSIAFTGLTDSGWERVSEFIELNSSVYIYVYQFEGADEIVRNAMVIHLDGDLISGVYQDADFYVLTD